MRLRCLIYLFLILLVAQVSAQVAEIPDPNLRQAVRETLDLPSNAPITQQEMLRLEELTAKEAQIENINGLEHATNLKSLALPVNQIQDITLLVDLINLNFLILRDNPIADLSPIANLTKLTYINLSGVIMEDLAPLSNLTQLRELHVIHCRIKDITAVSNLTQLVWLNLSANRIVDISPVANLTALDKFSIDRNQIVDISPLAHLTQLTDLTIANNAITDFRPLFGLNLQGVDVDIHSLQELAPGDVEIADPNLERAIREEMGLSSEVALTQLVMSQLIELDAGGNCGITDLTGLEHATNLKSLGLYRNPITDISPLVHLTQLEGFNLWGCRIVDLSPLGNLKNLGGIVLGNNRISDLSPLAELTNLTFIELESNQLSGIRPLAGLTNLTGLQLDHNQIADFNPLANLVNLEQLWINDNLGTDFTPLQNLNLTDFRYDQRCDIGPLLPPVRERIANRSFPSIHQAWDNVVGLDHLTLDQRYALHDLHWSPSFGLDWQKTATAPTYGLATSLSGDLARAREIRQRQLDLNPNMVFLVEARIHNHRRPEAFPADSDFWLRDAQGNIVKNAFNEHLIDFLKPEVQDLIVKRIVAVARCGLYDGIVLNGFFLNGIGFLGRQLHTATDEEIITATEDILRAVRSQVRDDFLILINTHRAPAPRYAEYVNGNFIDTLRGYDGGYTHDGLANIESTLLWSEENLRSPHINCIEGWGMTTEPPDGINNRRWMRVFTTISLTHSDGYVLYNFNGNIYSDPHHRHLWYPFWDADLGQPVGPKAQPYKYIEGLFIREFTNGWAVYNRSGQAKRITLPAPATRASDSGDNPAAMTHLLPDLDGEIYLKTKSLTDVNGDGR